MKKRMLLIFLLLLVGCTGKAPAEKTEVQADWIEQGLVLSGRWADADIVQTDNQWRMYFGIEPETGEELAIYSAVSSDGKEWELEDGQRALGTFPSALHLDDGSWRLYFQRGTNIGSAISEDSLTFIDESGSRVERGEYDTVAAPTVMQRSDGSYFMVYRASPEKDMYLLASATSDDGLTFTDKEILVEPFEVVLNEKLKYALIDSAELVVMDDGLHLFFRMDMEQGVGIYEMISDDEGEHWGEPTVVVSGSAQKGSWGDPTVGNINGEWYMYYTRLTEGIYYAIQP